MKYFWVLIAFRLQSVFTFHLVIVDLPLGFEILKDLKPSPAIFDPNIWPAWCQLNQIICILTNVLVWKLKINNNSLD